MENTDFVFNMCYSIILLKICCLNVTGAARCLPLIRIAWYQFHKIKWKSWYTIFQRLDFHMLHVCIIRSVNYGVLCDLVMFFYWCPYWWEHAGIIHFLICILSFLGDLGKAGKGEKAGSAGKSQKAKAPDPLELRVEQGFLSLLIFFYSLNIKIFGANCCFIYNFLPFVILWAIYTIKIWHWHLDLA